MATPQCWLWLHRQPGVVTFQVHGWGTMHQSLALRRAAEQGLVDGAGTLRVDLRHCTYMDSTFLGTMACLKRTVERQGGKLELVSPSPECCQQLRQMALDKLFSIVSEEELPEGWKELTSSTADVKAFQGNVVDAHQELAGLPGPASDPFRAVARCLTQAREAEAAARTAE